MLKISIRSQKGEIVKRIDVPWQFDPVLCGLDGRIFPFLGHIDPHGVTVFSGFQMLAVVKELRELGPDIADELGGRDALNRLSEEFLECARARRLLWIVGD